ncbi:hypothetical protein Tco_0365853 [Tanacetum coccineum]
MEQVKSSKELGLVEQLTHALEGKDLTGVAQIGYLDKLEHRLCFVPGRYKTSNVPVLPKPMLDRTDFASWLNKPYSTVLSVVKRMGVLWSLGGFVGLDGGSSEQSRNAIPDKMLLMQAQENGVALDEEQLLFLTGGHDNAIDEDVDEQPVQDLAHPQEKHSL